MAVTALSPNPAKRCFGRLAGYEDVNIADRLGRDPAMRWIVGVGLLRTKPLPRARWGGSRPGRLTRQANLAALTDLSGRWIGRRSFTVSGEDHWLDMDSSVSRTYGDQEGTAYNGHFALHLLPRCRVQPVRRSGAVFACGRATSRAHMTGARLLEPVVAAVSQDDEAAPVRGDAAFCLLGTYEFLEAED